MRFFWVMGCVVLLMVGCAGSEKTVVSVPPQSGDGGGGKAVGMPEKRQIQPSSQPSMWRAEAVSARVKHGEALQLRVTNTTDKPYEYQDPGGTNGCYRIFDVHVIVDDEVRYFTNYVGPGVLCPTVMIPPSLVVFKPGEPMAFVLDTGGQFYTEALLDKSIEIKKGPPPTKALPRGQHEAVIDGAGQRWTVEFEVY